MEIIENKKIPILFLIFKRENEALKAFEPIKKYRPQKLYIAADGPRNYVANEKERCDATRKAILNEIDWDCEVKTLFREKNLGCTEAVYGGISWLFENEEFGIINEDDVVLSADFFKFCEVLLPKYKDVEKVMIISSRNHSGKSEESNEYYYTPYPKIWGWATWKRAWTMNNNTFDGFDEFKLNYLIRRLGLLQGILIYRNLKKCSNPMLKNESWDYTWSYVIFKNEGLCINPGVNLSINVGIGSDGGTNYNAGDPDPYSCLGVGRILWPLKLRGDVKVDKELLKADKKDYLNMRFLGLKKKIKKIFTK